MKDTVRKIYDLALEISKELDKEVSGDMKSQITAEKLAVIQDLLLSLKNSNEFALQKISEIGKHLKPQMSLLHFANFLVPLERYLDKGIVDSDFVVTNTDRTSVQKTFPLILVLENLRSAFNVGSIFRSADAIGVSHIYLAGYTATPEQPIVQKTALGAQNIVSWSQTNDLPAVLTKLKSEGYTCVALETAEKAIGFYAQPLKEKTVFILGNERFGLMRETLALADEVRMLPMYGVKNSLNVANTASIVCYEWSRQNA